ncbi:MAG: hypothetical protein AABX31_02530 [Nanoarchaeota archaeon]
MIRREDRPELLEILIDPNKIGLGQKAISKLLEIVGLQFQENTICEVSGVAYVERESNLYQLGLDVVKSQNLIDIENAIKLFGQGDYSKVSILADYANTTCSSIEEVMELPIEFKTARALFNFAAKSPEKILLLEKHDREKWVNLYLELLGSYVRYNLEEIQFPKDFLGFFHCHSEGSKPSPIDLKSTVKTGIPELVISTTTNYKTEGVSMYVCSQGEFKMVYQGLLQPKQ